jgi:hypothetical protein
MKSHPCGGFLFDGDGADENPRSGFEERCESSATTSPRSGDGPERSEGWILRNKRKIHTPAAGRIDCDADRSPDLGSTSIAIKRCEGRRRNAATGRSEAEAERFATSESRALPPPPPTHNS